MLGMEACTGNRRRDLRQFIQLSCPSLDKTRTKFFHQSLWGILNSGSLTVSNWLPWINDGCQELHYRQKRLLNQFKSKHWNSVKALQEHQHYWAKHIQIDTPIIIDLTDLPRPRGTKLPYISLVRDGSEGKLHLGYWCIEIYAYFGQSRITPLVLDPYSSDAPEVYSENAQILAAVDAVMAATEDRGVLVMDAGADRDKLLIPWIDDKRRFVIRLRGDRHLLLDNGSLVPANHLAEQLLKNTSGHRRSWQRVYLPERPNHPLYLVVKSIPGKDRPLILLSTLLVEDINTARTVLSYYRQRWKCEEAARFLKTDLGIELFSLRLYESFPRLFLLAALAMSFLTWLALRYVNLRRWLCAKRPGQHKIKFLYYRLRAWLQHHFSPRPTARSPT